MGSLFLNICTMQELIVSSMKYFPTNVESFLWGMW